MADYTWSQIKTWAGLNNVTNESKETMFTNAALTGTPTAPTATAGTNTTQIATTEFVNTAVSGAGYITGITGDMVTTALGYTPPQTDTTYNVVTSSANGLAPSMPTSTSSTISSQSTEFVLTTTSGGTPTWKKLPTNAFNNNTYSASDFLPTSFYEGVNTVTTLASLPVTKQSITATLSAATNISLSSALPVGRCLNIRCIPSAAFTQPIPAADPWSSMSGSSVSVTTNVPFEINIWCYATGKYSIAVLETK